MQAVAHARRTELEQLGERPAGREDADRATDADTTDAEGLDAGEGSAAGAVGTGHAVVVPAADPNELPLDDLLA